MTLSVTVKQKNLILPSHPKPKRDELFSSWLTRTASSNGMSVISFLNYAGVYSEIVDRDYDINLSDAAVTAISYRTGVATESLAACFLSMYDAALFETRSEFKTTPPWILPLRIRPGRVGYGMQFCPHCLGQYGYYRKSWRFAFVTSCLEHGTTLVDRCTSCESPVVFGTGYAWMAMQSRSFASLSSCMKCGRSYTKAEPERADRNILEFQSLLVQVLDDGYATMDGEKIHSVLFFNGVRRIVRLLISGRRSEILRTEISKDLGSDSVAADWRRGERLEFLEARKRAVIFRLLAQLLDSWPHNFVRYCRSAKIGLTELMYQSDLEYDLYGPQKAIPYWCLRQFRTHFQSQPPTHCFEEISNILRFVDSMDDPAKRRSFMSQLGSQRLIRARQMLVSRALTTLAMRSVAV